jgi:photosystem II stability/assembly factor-like uncharacterized protein
MTVWRTNDGGQRWERGETGSCRRTPIGVLREASGPDDLDPGGVYFGTSTGQLYGSADGGESWSSIATTLPPIWSVEAIVV